MGNSDIYEKYKNGLNMGFDKDHSSYRAYVFIKYMDSREKEFVNNFKFEGDDNFTRAKQRTMLKLAFRYGFGGVVNTVKLTKNNISEEAKEYINLTNLNLKELVESKMGNYIPVSLFPFKFDTEERFFEGTGITAPLHNVSRKSYPNLTVVNTASLKFNENRMSGYWWWLIPAYMHATAETVIKKRLTQLDGKLVNNTVNNSHITKKFENVYDVDNSFLDISPSQSSLTNNNKESVLDITKMLDTKIKKFDMSNGETVIDLLEFTEKYEERIKKEQGERSNVNSGQNERSISKDFESEELHWQRLENEFKDQMQMFCDDYFKVFGVKIKAISLNEKVIDEMRERELQVAGHGDSKGGGDNEKDRDKKV